jgi:chromosome segregation ATPase
MNDPEIIEQLLQLRQERDDLEKVIQELKKALDSRESDIADLNNQLSEFENPCPRRLFIDANNQCVMFVEKK